jgi:hypothetical protein
MPDDACANGLPSPAAAPHVPIVSEENKQIAYDTRKVKRRPANLLPPALHLRLHSPIYIYLLSLPISLHWYNCFNSNASLFPD